MKKTLLALLSTALLLGACGCGSPAQSTSGSLKTIKVGASPVPHKEILEKAAPLLKEKGYKLEIVEFTDYVTPNTALQQKDIDANFFQHIPYLEKTCQEKNYDLDYTVKVHLEPLGVYSQKVKSLKDLANGAEVAIPNDPTNGSRALRLLESQNLIKLKDGELVTKSDITENAKNLKIKELAAAQLPRVLGEVDASVINTNFALEAGLNPTKDSLALEDKNSPYANVIAVRKEDKDKPEIKALSEAMNSPEIKKFIEEKYKGSILPAF